MKDQHELFRDRDDAHWRADRAEYVTGLEQLSDYTLGQLPHDLRDVKDGVLSYDELVEKQRQLLEAVAPAVYSNRDHEAAKLAQLDLLFMLGGYIPSGTGDQKGKAGFAIAPTHLLGLIDYQAGRFGLPRYMNYEMIIDVNVAEFMRTGRLRVYSDGANRTGERDFYIGHYYAEPHIKEAAWQLRSLLNTASPVHVTETLQSASAHTNQFTGDVDQYTRLSNFGYFRPYLARYPDSTPNASGAFMPSPQLFELVLHRPTEAQVTYLTEALPFYPTWAQPLIREWMEQSLQGHNIVDAVKSGRLQMDHDQLQMLLQVARNFRAFKLTHIGMTQGQIPQAFPPVGDPKLKLSLAELKDFGEQDVFEEGAVPGTGGFNPQNVLGNGVYRLQKLVEELQSVDAQLLARMFPEATPATPPIVQQRRRTLLGRLGITKNKE